MSEVLRKSRDQQARDRRLQLLDEALRLFAEQGFAGATIKQLALRVGVSQGLIYHYFQSKEDLFLATMERHSAQPEIETLYAALRETPLAEALPRLAQGTFQALWSRKEVIWVFFRELHSHPHLANLAEGMRQGCISALTAHLQERVDRGELRPHDCSVTSRALLSTIFMLHLTGIPREGFLEDLAECILRGILP